MRPLALALYLALSLSWLALPAAGAPERDAAPVVARAIKAFGGRERIEALSTLLAASRFRRAASGGFEEGALTEFYAFPRKARREHKNERGPRVEVAGTDGVRAWAVRERTVLPEDAARFIVPLRMYQLGRLLLDVEGGRVRAERVPGADEGRTRLLLTLDDGEMIQLDVEDESGRIARYAGEAHAGAATDVLVIDIVKWREEDGHLLPAHLVTRVNGEVAEEVILTSVRVNGSMDARFFEPPWGAVGPPPRKL